MKARMVAEHVLARASERGLSFCPLKLQKVLYYCQGYHLALSGEPLFDEAIEAWQYGPVVPEIFQDFRQYGSRNIPLDCHGTPSAPLSNESAKVLDYVLDHYGLFSGMRLVTKTHHETPWQNHGPVEGGRGSKVIPHEDMREFFSEQMKSAFDDDLADLLDAAESAEEDSVALPNSVQSADDFVNWVRSL